MNEHSHTHGHAPVKLTKNQSLVMGVLTRSNAPLSAYTILDQLRDDGFRAPPQVYRALEKLISLGLVHRLESLNAFVACQHTGCGAQQTVTFMICEKCDHVSETVDAALTDDLKKIAEDTDFELSKSTVELRGICGECQRG